jgi:hypothetical protein
VRRAARALRRGLDNVYATQRSAVFMSTRTAQHQDANVHSGCVLSLANPLGRVHVDARRGTRVLRRGLDNVHVAQRSATRSAVFMSMRTMQHQDANVYAGYVLFLASPMPFDTRHSCWAARGLIV